MIRVYLAGVFCAATLAVGAAPLVAQTRSMARGRVLADSTERAIAGATVSIPRLHLDATSDSLGRFALVDVAPGDHLVIVRRLGFVPVSTVVHFAPGDSVDADFLLVPTIQQLASVDVTGTAESPKLAEFAERRALGIGHFLTSAEIERSNSTKLSNILSVLPGLLVVRANGRGDVYIATSRGAQSIQRAGRGRPCRAEIILDGVPVPEGADQDFDHLVGLRDVAAVEWYSGQAEMPVKYAGTKNACAVLVIWTK